MMLNLASGLMCLAMGLAFFVLHATSNPSNRIWPNLPRYVRTSFFFTGAAMIYRGINFLDLSRSSSDAIGSINAEGFIATICMTSTVLSLTLYALRRTYPGLIWDRLNHIEDLAQSDPHGPALATLALDGAKVVKPMGAMPP